MYFGVDCVMNWFLIGINLLRCLKWNLFFYVWWNDVDNDNEIDFIFISEIIMNMIVLLIMRMIVMMMLKVVLVIMIIIKNDIDKKKEINDSVL